MPGQVLAYQKSENALAGIATVLEFGDARAAAARICDHQGWRSNRYEYFEFDHVHQYTDKDGVWQWDEAPEDAFEADICRPGGMTMTSQSLLARDEEYVFRPPPLLVIRGTVVDQETQQPIDSFRVVPGIRSSPSHMNWVQDGRDGAFQATGGKFKFTRNYGYLAHLARIEAPGYLPSVSREIASDEGAVSLKFELRRGHDVAATVLTPEGRPAAGAKIALGLPGSQISIQDGSIDDSSTYAARTDTDDQGKFSFPPQGGSYQLVITHSSGYAHIKAGAEDRQREIKLTAWGRVEGTFRVAGESVAGVTLILNTDAMHSYGRDVPNIFAHYETSSGREGRFVFDKVCAGKHYLQLVAEHEVAERNAPRFRASVDVDGSFRIDDVPAGDYTLSFSGRGGRHPKAVAGSVRHEVEVPEAAGDLDLGPILLK